MYEDFCSSAFIHRIRFTAIRTKCSTHYNMEELDVWVLRSEKEGLWSSHFSWTFVDPDCGVKGVGSVLIQKMEEKAREVEKADSLIVKAALNDLNAVILYKKCGFVPATHQISEQSCLHRHKMIKK
ncbi:uncharacterized protein [Montipora foliosa]|uniref:uncharacterized protein n=1 Tax=Montipora foliosa TaxID=591990 RepID=UPI0035F1A28B